MKQQVNIQAVKAVIELRGLNKKHRKQELVFQRFACYDFLRNYTPYSLEKIGSMFGGKNHCTILYGLRKHDEFLSNKDQWYIQIINDVKNELIQCLEDAVPEKPKIMSYYEQRIIECGTYQQFRRLRLETMIRVNNQEIIPNLATQKIHTLL